MIIVKGVQGMSSNQKINRYLWKRASKRVLMFLSMLVLFFVFFALQLREGHKEAEVISVEVIDSFVTFSEYGNNVHLKVKTIEGQVGMVELPDGFQVKIGKFATVSWSIGVLGVISYQFVGYEAKKAGSNR